MGKVSGHEGVALGRRGNEGGALGRRGNEVSGVEGRLTRGTRRGDLGDFGHGTKCHVPIYLYSVLVGVLDMGCGYGYDRSRCAHREKAGT